MDSDGITLPPGRFRVFISAVTSEFQHARSEIAKDLRSRGVEVKFQEDFRQEADADTTLRKLHNYIRDCHAVVCLVGTRSGSFPPAAAARPFGDMRPRELPDVSYTQWEFLFARHFGKRLSIYIANTDFIPSLSNPLDEESPGLQNRFKTWLIEEQGLDRSGFSNTDQLARQVLREEWPQYTSSRKRYDYFQYVYHPENHVKRLSIYKKIKSNLLEKKQIVALTALHGMGGIGKTFTARALCDDADIRAEFPDGILWTTLGKTPDLKDRLNEWAKKLGCIIPTHAPSVNELKQILADRLSGKICLLIVDDVWHSKHIKAFRIGSGQSRMLFTTRDKAIPFNVQAEVISIQLMSLSESIELLNIWAGDTLKNTADSLKREIVQRLGGLPLAIKLAGAQLRSKTPEKWLVDFGGVRMLKTQRPEDPSDPHESIKKTFELSLEELTQEKRSLYVACAIFKEDEKIPERVVCNLWEGLNKPGNDAETEELIDDLALRALLEVDPDNRTIWFHDLLRESMSLELGEDGELTAHRVLMDVYRKPAGWSSVKDDGYLYDHLCYHLAAMGAEEELKALFADQKWYHRRVSEASDYHYDGYIADLSAAWKLCMERGAEDEAWLADCFRYALIRTSINDIAENHIPALVTRALEIGLWKPARALSMAERISDPSLAASFGQALLESDRLDKSQHQRASEITLRAAMRIGNERYRFGTLIHLASCLNENEKQVAVQYCLKAALQVREETLRCQALLDVTPHLLGAQKEETLGDICQTIVKIKDEKTQFDVLVSVAQHLSESKSREALNQAYKNIDKIKDEVERFHALTCIAPMLSEKLRGEDLYRIIGTSDEISKNETLVCDTLAAVIPHLTIEEDKEKVLDMALNTAKNVPNMYWQCDALMSLAPCLKDDRKENILHLAHEAARKISAPETRAQKLIELAPKLQKERQNEALNQAYDAARQIPDHEGRSQTWGALAAELKNDRRQEALKQAYDAAKQIPNDEARAHALFDLIPQLKERRREKARHLAKETLRLALEGICEIDDDQERGYWLAALAPQLDMTMLDQTLQRLQMIQDSSACAHALTILAVTMPENRKERIVNNAFEAAAKIADDFGRSERIAALAAHLDPSMHHKAFEIAVGIKGDWGRSKALSSLVPYLSATMLTKVFDAIFNMKNEDAFSYCLARLAPKLSESQLELSYRSALALKEHRARSKVLAALAPKLNEKQRQSALHKALHDALKVDEYPPSTLSALIPQLQGDLLEEAFQSARSITDEYKCANSLVAFAPRLDAAHFEQLVQTLVNMKDKLHCARSLEKISRLPALSGEQRKNVLEVAFKTAKALPDKKFRIEILAVLAEQLNGQLREEAIGCAYRDALGILEEEEQAFQLTDLVPLLHGSMLEQALETIFSVTDKETFVDLLLSLPPNLQLQGARLEKAFQIASGVGEERTRANALVTLAPYLQGQLLKKAFQAALNMTTGKYRSYLLVALSPYLQGQMLEQGLQAALKIVDREHRIQAIKALTPRFKGTQLEDAFQASLEMTDFSSVAIFLESLMPDIDQTKKRKLAAHLLFWSQNGSREDVLNTAVPLFIKGGFHPKTLEQIASHIADICLTWR